MTISRKPPADVRRRLRQEVGFGCPVADCRKAILTWHHFDPPWNERQHHEEKGMLALCKDHHAAADAGVYSKEELRAMKNSPHAVEEVKAAFPWAKKNILVRLGGVYCGADAVEVELAGDTLIRLSKGEADLLLLSLALNAPNGAKLLQIEENVFDAAPSALSDLEMNTAPTQVRARFAGKDAEMHLTFNRITSDELAARMVKDRKRSKQIAQKDERPIFPAGYIESHPPEEQALLREHEKRMQGDSDDGEDRNAESVMSWVHTYCMDDEKKIPLLDFKTMSLHNSGQSVRIKDGVCDDHFRLLYGTHTDERPGGVIRLSFNRGSLAIK